MKNYIFYCLFVFTILFGNAFSVNSTHWDGIPGYGVGYDKTNGNYFYLVRQSPVLPITFDYLYCLERENSEFYYLAKSILENALVIRVTSYDENGNPINNNPAIDVEWEDRAEPLFGNALNKRITSINDLNLKKGVGYDRLKGIYLLDPRVYKRVSPDIFDLVLSIGDRPNVLLDKIGGPFQMLTNITLDAGTFMCDLGFDGKDMVASIAIAGQNPPVKTVIKKEAYPQLYSTIVSKALNNNNPAVLVKYTVRIENNVPFFEMGNAVLPTPLPPTIPDYVNPYAYDPDLLVWNRLEGFYSGTVVGTPASTGLGMSVVGGLFSAYEANGTHPSGVYGNGFETTGNVNYITSQNISFNPITKPEGATTFWFKPKFNYRLYEKTPNNWTFDQSAKDHLGNSALLDMGNTRPVYPNVKGFRVHWGSLEWEIDVFDKEYLISFSNNIQGLTPYTGNPNEWHNFAISWYVSPLEGSIGLLYCQINLQFFIDGKLIFDNFIYENQELVSDSQVNLNLVDRGAISYGGHTLKHNLILLTTSFNSSFAFGRDQHNLLTMDGVWDNIRIFSKRQTNFDFSKE
jgi:hypothetical protein